MSPRGAAGALYRAWSRENSTPWRVFACRRRTRRPLRPALSTWAPSAPKSSYLRKTAGAPFAAGDAQRFFVQGGFQVQYYDSVAPKRNGRFDLRNIVTLRPTADPSVTDGVGP